MRKGYADMCDLHTLPKRVKIMYGVRVMLVNWLDVRSKVTHFGGLVLAWFWAQYTFDKNFQNGVDTWVHGLNMFWRTLFGASISFYFWYRNPKRKDQQQ